MTGGLRAVLARAREDVDAVLDRDPAARGRAEVVLASPGLHALWAHRVAHALWQRPRWRLVARLVAHAARRRTGVELHPAARLGRRVVIDHGMGVVVGETAVVGDDALLFHGATLGGRGDEGPRAGRAGGVSGGVSGGGPSGVAHRHPRLGRDVVVGAGATVLGPVVVGDGARIGAGAVVLVDVPAGATAVGVPARVLPARRAATGVSAAVVAPGTGSVSAAGPAAPAAPVTRRR